MQLEIKPSNFNSFPLAGLLLPGANMHSWMMHIQALQLPLSAIHVYPIPNILANSIWGCFIISENNFKNVDISNGMLCQLVHNRLYIPQYASLSPQIRLVEMEKIFANGNHIMHPEFGLVALDMPIDWTSVFNELPPVPTAVVKPAEASFVPSVLHKMEVKALPADEVLDAMKQNLFPQQQTMDDKPLSLIEKIKYHILKSLFSGGESSSGTSSGSTSAPAKLPKWMEALGKMMDKWMPKENKWLNKLQQNLDELEKRNQSEMEKLMDMFRNNPDEALKYAIPLDEDGTNRGGNQGAFELSKRWNDFSLNRNGNYGVGGSTTFQDDAYQKLRDQYTKTAQELVKHKQYEKAAFVYMKLLKNYYMAAQTLEEGTLFPEAAAIFLKHIQNKERAAQCYEKGNMTTEAIGLYKELKQHEKAGDLYLSIKDKKAAFKQYEIVIDEHTTSGRYVKASLLYRHKMDDTTSAQHLLMDGWRQEKDAFNCLNNYFQNIEDEKELEQAIDQVYINETNHKNKPVFLKALQHEHKKHPALQLRTREIAYEIISETASSVPSIVDELKGFNADPSLGQDASRYKLSNK